MTVPIANPTISEAAKEDVLEVIDSGMLAAGDIVREFEDAFASYVGVNHAIAMSSGTTALQITLESAGIGEGDTVVTSPFSFIASANAVRHADASVVFADIRPNTYNLDPVAVRSMLERRDDIDAVMPVHLYGLPADMDAFRAIADDYDVKIFEDAAQAHGATVGGDHVGSIGTAGAFSFYPTKNMTTGEGGMVTTDDPELAGRARRLINHGREGKYQHTTVGYNFRMTNLQAAIGLEQVDRLPGWVEGRRANAERLTDRLDAISGIKTPTIPDGRTHAFHQYTIRTGRRSDLKERLKRNDVGYGVYYPNPIPDQPAYDVSVDVPHARAASEGVLSLPVHPNVSQSNIKKIVETIEL
jgi:dTDP-4-amino-4,6-dideoxygalactose transaminase